ncbi:MAG: ATP-dependent DNA ligase [Candidatus Babeliales bacterium]|nr:ATP-dependent DNA ligase [Candidatus Babeliales bacterium]
MNFDTVGHAFAQIEATSGRVEMTKLLAVLLKDATAAEASIICNISLGQLNPPHIGTQFQIAQINMIKAIADLLHKPEDEIKKQAQELGDLGLVVAQGQWTPAERVSVQHVYGALHQIEQLAGTGSQEEKNNQLRDLLAQVDPVSAKYIVRIVLGKLRLGFSDMTIIDALSWMEVGDKSLHDVIEDAYNICADIGLIAFTLKEHGIQAVKNMSIHIGIPIRPAAAERLPTARAIVEKIGHCIAQPKLDGFRLQIHMDKTGPTPQIHFFSRNLQDMSAMFPDIKKAIEHLDVKNIICEGEAIVYDVHSGHYLPFQETVKRKRKHDIEEVMEQLPLRVIIFDLLYLDGQEYMSKTHHERRDKALEVFKNFNDDAIQVIEEQVITTPGELEDYFVQNIASGLEGLVVKKDDSVYRPGKRNFNWIKLKRQEEGHLEDTIDCVVLGYYAGEGKRAAFGIGACLVGVYNKAEDRFETVAKIGTGFKDLEWIELKKKCDALKVDQKPKNVVCDKMLEPDVWVSPELVLIIRADEITMSPVHAAGKTADKLGYALRFPRFMGYSIDKSPQDATTIEEVEHLYKDQFVR